MLLKKTIAYVWIISVLIANIGVSLHTLYCFCKQEYEYSFFNNIQHHCQHDSKILAQNEIDELPACCRKAMKCAKNEGTNQEKNKHACCENPKNDAENEKNGCTKREFKYFKLNIDLNNVETEDLTFSAIWASVATMPTMPFHFHNYLISKYLSRFSGNKSPPPQYLVLSHTFGRGLLNFVQVYRC